MSMKNRFTRLLHHCLYHQLPCTLNVEAAFLSFMWQNQRPGRRPKTTARSLMLVLPKPKKKWFSVIVRTPISVGLISAEARVTVMWGDGLKRRKPYLLTAIKPSLTTSNNIGNCIVIGEKLWVDVTCKKKKMHCSLLWRRCALGGWEQDVGGGTGILQDSASTKTVLTVSTFTTSHTCTQAQKSTTTLGSCSKMPRQTRCRRVCVSWPANGCGWVGNDHGTEDCQPALPMG